MSDHRTDGASVAEECEAFLSGRFVEDIVGAADVPPWAWLNALAHGTLADVERLARDEGAACAPWRHVQRRIAIEVLGLARGDAQRLQALQTCLTAVELDVATRPGGATTPAALLGSVLARLEGPAGGCFSL
ncbi:MAG TPA: hypothetical protein VHN98_12835 [Acidimicrobiales bacterium]|nr:hypothetical protein [Acidimicrobiales bacterium]